MSEVQRKETYRVLSLTLSPLIPNRYISCVSMWVTYACFLGSSHSNIDTYGNSDFDGWGRFHIINEEIYMHFRVLPILEAAIIMRNYDIVVENCLFDYQHESITEGAAIYGPMIEVRSWHRRGLIGTFLFLCVCVCFSLKLTLMQGFAKNDNHLAQKSRGRLICTQNTQHESAICPEVGIRFATGALFHSMLFLFFLATYIVHHSVHYFRTSNKVVHTFAPTFTHMLMSCCPLDWPKSVKCVD